MSVFSFINKHTDNNYAKVFIFDLDDTLISTTSGKKFPINSNDWNFLPEVIPKLKKISNSAEFDVVIISNQAGHKRNPNLIESKLHNVTTALKNEKIEFRLFAALARDRNRKPSTGIIEDFIDSKNIEKFYIVGDAAGRERDFSDSDIKFAHNISLITGKRAFFYTPEDFFSASKPKTTKIDPASFSGINPARILKDSRGNTDVFSHSQILNSILSQDTLVLMCGPPACGKSTAARRLAGFLTDREIENHVIHLDEIGNSQPKAIKIMKEQFSLGSAVVIIDATNRSESTRQKYLQLQGVFSSYVVFDFDFPRELVEHLNVVRCRATPGVVEIPVVAYRTFYKNYEKPKKNAISVEFCPRFENELSKLYFLQR